MSNVVRVLRCAHIEEFYKIAAMELAGTRLGNVAASSLMRLIRADRKWQIYLSAVSELEVRDDDGNFVGVVRWEYP